MTPADALSHPKTDFELLFRRIKASVLEGSDPERTAALLRQKEPLQHLSPDQCMEWSRLAQMAGEIATALEVLETIEARDPSHDAAWLEHWDLLQLLGRHREGVALRARILETRPDLRGRLLPGGTPPQSEEAMDLLDEPFARIQKEARLLEKYMTLFQGREDCFARQWVNREEGTHGYVPEHRAITEADVRDHLRGLKTCGIYLLQHDSRVRLGVLDADLKDPKDLQRMEEKEKGQPARERDYLFERIADLGRERGLPSLVECSGGKGYHFWFFFASPVEAGLVRGALTDLADRVRGDLSLFNLEAFPKQNKLGGKGLGNLVKLPLGIHRVTGKPSFFLPQVQGDVWAQMEVLQKVSHCKTEDLGGRNRPGPGAAQVLPHPRQSQWMQQHPELQALVERCPVLGQLIVACRNGKSLGMREEKVLFGTLAFLSRGKTLLHTLLQGLPEYNPHLVDYRLSTVRGTPLGCKKVHTLLGVNTDFCAFEHPVPYAHPLLHCPGHLPADAAPKAERVENLREALETLRLGIAQVLRFLPPGVLGGPDLPPAPLQTPAELPLDQPV